MGDKKEDFKIKAQVYERHVLCLVSKLWLGLSRELGIRGKDWLEARFG